MQVEVEERIPWRSESVSMSRNVPRCFREYNLNQPLLLPQDLREWLPEDHLAHFILDLLAEAKLDLSAIYAAYATRRGGQPPYHPRMLVALLLYGYCIGVRSSRKIERATYTDAAFRMLAGDQHPDHDTIAEFRRRHLQELAGLFVQVLRLCQKAKLVALGHVALDGTKERANASKHKAMSYERMEKSEAELAAEVERMLAEAEAVDRAEDAQYGKGVRGDELPEDLRFKQKRLATIRKAMKSLEAEAKEKAEVKRAERAAEEERLRVEGKSAPPRQEISETVEPKAQRNFTDPESRIMKDGATKSFEQCYNAQAAVDAKAQIIVAAAVTQEANDKQQVKPVVEAIQRNCDGAAPKKLLADNGYFSEANVEYLQGEGIDPYLATGRLKHHEKAPPAPRGRVPKSASIKDRMARKLRTLRGRATYSKRKEIVEPVFGQIKGARGIRQFLLRGLEKVTAEWTLICLTHNVLKLARSGWRPAAA